MVNQVHKRIIRPRRVNKAVDSTSDFNCVAIRLLSRWRCIVNVRSCCCWCYRELSLRRGDIVYLLRAVDDNWFEGEHHGLVGRFPVSYVEARLDDMVKTAFLAVAYRQFWRRLQMSFTYLLLYSLLTTAYNISQTAHRLQLTASLV